MIGFETAVTMLQAISATPAVPLVRALSIAPDTVLHLLEVGAYGMICLTISTAAQTADFVAACRYPPDYKKSFGPARRNLFGGPDYFEQANDQILVVPMIESAQGLNTIDGIRAVSGINMIYIGPNDLARDVGKIPGAEMADSATSTAIAHIRERAKSAGVATGIFCSDGALARRRREEGFDLVTPGNDFCLLMSAMSAALTATQSSAHS